MTTMLALIQRFLSPENTSRKRKRDPGFFSSETMSTSNEEINNLRDTIAQHSQEIQTSTADREHAISEFLALADENRGNAKRRKHKSGRLSTIEESAEAEYDGTKSADEMDLDTSMVDVDLGVRVMDLDVPAGAIHTNMDSHDGMIVDQDVWTWKGGNKSQT